MFSRSSNCLILRFLISLFALVFCLAASLVAAVAMAPDDASPVDVIRTDVTAQTNHDWSTFLAIRTTKAGPPENRNDWIKVREINPEADIMKNIVTAQLAGIKPLSFSLAEGLTRMDKYLDLYSEVRAYYVAIDYRLNEENRSFYNGVNYRFYAIASEEGRWVIVEASEAPVYRMVEAGYGFGTQEEELGLRIQEERELTGRFINPKGEVIEILAAPAQVAGAGDHQRPSVIKVYRVQLARIDTVDFYPYVKNVLPNEWIASWPAQSLRAGALASKMYGWYRVYFAKYPGKGYDVRDDTWDQVYKPGSDHPNTNRAVDDVNGIGVDRADGKLFETQYCAGTYGPEKPSGALAGRMSQWGTKYWADQGKDYSFMVHYYWDNSPQAGGQLAHFFNYGVSLPTVETRPATSIGETGAILNGRIVNDGGSSIIERRFDWGKTSSCSDGWTANVNVSGNYFSYYLAGLNPGTTYYFRAWAKNAAGWSHGDVLSFKTTQSISPPTLISPPNNSHQTSSITFQWTSVSGATKYKLFVKLPGSSSWLSDETTATSYPYSPTLIGAYHWKVQAYANGSWSDDSSEWIFYFDGSPAPTLISPPNNSETTALRPTFQWSSVSGSTCYELQLARNSSFTDMVRNNLCIHGTSWQLDNQDLTPGQTYYWRVRSAIPIGQWSNTWHFRIRPAQYTLTTSVNPSGSGSVSLNPSGGTYDAGTVVTLTATPSSGYRFDHWSGNLSGSSNPTTITMNSNKNG